MKLLRAIWTVIDREPYEFIILMLLACAMILSIRLEQEKAEKQRAISELNEIRTEREWSANLETSFFEPTQENTPLRN